MLVVRSFPVPFSSSFFLISPLFLRSKLAPQSGGQQLDASVLVSHHPGGTSLNIRSNCFWLCHTPTPNTNTKAITFGLGLDHMLTLISR